VASAGTAATPDGAAAGEASGRRGQLTAAERQRLLDSLEEGRPRAACRRAAIAIRRRTGESRALGLALCRRLAALARGVARRRRLQAQSVRLTVDRPELTLEEQAYLTVTVEGGGRAEPKLPPLETSRCATPDAETRSRW
jgi:hypothetical protein